MRNNCFVPAMLGILAITTIAHDAHGQTWEVSTRTDDLTNDIEGYTGRGPRVGPVRPMGFPYHDTQAQIYAICRLGQSPYIGIGFTNPPPLSNEILEDGYSESLNRVSFDGEVKQYSFTREWGSSYLFVRDEEFIDAVAIAARMRLELRWYGEGRVVFAFPLAGSGSGIEDLRAKCDLPERSQPPPEPTQPLPERTTPSRTTEELLRSGPTHTPWTVPPRLKNEREAQRILEREYPPRLRDAGIGGLVRIHFLVTEEGMVRDTKIDESSGQAALDEAALRVAHTFEFTPAVYRDTKVPVWISLPITFSTTWQQYVQGAASKEREAAIATRRCSYHPSCPAGPPASSCGAVLGASARPPRRTFQAPS